MEHSFTYTLLIVLLNVFSGYFREGHIKFSAKWTTALYVAIFLTVFFYVQSSVSGLFIIPILILAVMGQAIGARFRRNKMSPQEMDELNQIPDLDRSVVDNVEDSKVSVVLFNMGGPKTNDDVKDFQEHLFKDSRLIRFPLSFLLQNIFAWALVTFRLKGVKERYMLMGGGSPIYPSTENQVKALQEELNRRGRALDVSYSFNYSPPFPETTIEQIKQANKTHIMPVSLYPHYSKATTGSNMYYLKNAANNLYPELQFLKTSSYHVHDGYIQAFADRVYEQIKPGESLDDFYLIFSAHGLPVYFQLEGDPYAFMISQTVAQILAKLKRVNNWVIAYQSAVGPFQWLKPSTDDMIKALAKRGYKRLLIVPVSFVGDHIETTCEIDIEYRHMAKEVGITDYRMSKAIETHPGFIRALADTVEGCLSQSSPELTQLSETERIGIK